MPSDDTSHYEEAFKRALASVSSLAEGRLSANDSARRAGQLLGCSPQQRALLLRNSRQAGRSEVVDALIDRGRKLLSSDPAGAVSIFAVALEVVGCLPTGRPWDLVAADAAARCWANWANAHRLLDRWSDAQEGFEKAEASLRSGSGDPLALGEVARLKALLLRDRRDLDGALEASDRAVRWFESVGSGREIALAQVVAATVLAQQGSLPEALERLDFAQAAMAGSEDQALELSIWHNRAAHLTDLGDSLAARRALRRAKPLYERVGGELFRLRGRWLEGRLLVSEERWASAIQELERVHRRFTARGMAYETALVGLDLALAYSGARRPLEVQRLAREMLPFFQAEAIPGEATAAFLLFARAAEELRTNEGMIRDLLVRLQPLRRSTLRPARS